VVRSNTLEDRALTEDEREKYRASDFEANMFGSDKAGAGGTVTHKRGGMAEKGITI